MNNVLIEMDILFFGGSEKQFRNIISALAINKDCNVHVLIENKSLVSDQQLIDDFLQKNTDVQFHFMNSSAMKYNHSFALLRYITKIFSLLKLFLWHIFSLSKLNIDVAMVNNMTGLMMVPLLKQKGCYVIYNERNTGRQVTNKRFKMQLLKKCNKVIANSNVAATYLQGVIGKNVDVYNNGFLIEERLTSRKEVSDTYRILLPGRINPIKNQLYVIKALSCIANKNFKLILAGGVENSAYENKIISYLNDHNFQDKVEILGFVQNMKSEYEKADLIILPSIEEGTPNVLLEAYMYGRITLCSDIKQNVDCTIEKKSIFPLDDVNQLASILSAVIDGTYFENMESIIEKNAEFVKENYSMEKMTASYQKLFSERNWSNE